MTNHYEQLKNEIQEVCDLKKLEFGCEVLWKENKKDKEIYLSIFENWVDKYKSIRALMPLGNQGIIDVENITEILGKEPVLADVLRTIKVKNKYLMVREDGFLVQEINLHPLKEVPYEVKNIYWNLSKDRLCDQDDSVKEFLYKLICKFDKICHWGV